MRSIIQTWREGNNRTGTHRLLQEPPHERQETKKDRVHNQFAKESRGKSPSACDEGSPLERTWSANQLAIELFRHAWEQSLKEKKYGPKKQ
jgi:hypothetical protein